MTEQEKFLLLKDLCARLPYGIICHYETVIPMFGDVINNGELQEIKHRGEYFIVNGATCLYEDIKPYLRPMSSMTEEERKEFENILEGIVDGIERWDKPDLCEEYDWLNAHHFDYRGLIPMGLALEAPEGMYSHYDEEFNDGWRNWSPRDLT